MSACQDSGGFEAETVALPSPSAEPVVDLAGVCPKVQEALDSAFEGTGPLPPAEDYRNFADAIEELTNEVGDADGAVLRELEDASRAAAKDAEDRGAGPDDNVAASAKWLDAVDRVQAACADEGAPLD
jgi:hypothetical protein